MKNVGRITQNEGVRAVRINYDLKPQETPKPPTNRMNINKII